MKTFLKIVVLLFFIIGCVGYFENIYAIWQAENMLEGKNILRLMGVFVPPLGAIFGFL